MHISTTAHTYDELPSFQMGQNTMPTQRADLSYLDLARQAAAITERAARLTLSYFRTPLDVAIKADRSPVTSADRRAEEAMRKDLRRAFPDWGILGEEMGLEERGSEYLWTVDPLDGTRSFIRGVPLFGTLLGLLHRGEPVLGVMILPALDETYVAVRGHGATCNGVPVRVASCRRLGEAAVSCGDLDRFREVDQQPLFTALSERAATLRTYTDCFGHALVLRGAFHAMVDPAVAPWDVVPIACLVREAGGVAFTFGGDTVFHRPRLSFISCAPNLREPLMQLLQPQQQERQKAEVAPTPRNGCGQPGDAIAARAHACL